MQTDDVYMRLSSWLEEEFFMFFFSAVCVGCQRSIKTMDLNSALPPDGCVTEQHFNMKLIGVI